MNRSLFAAVAALCLVWNGAAIAQSRPGPPPPDGPPPPGEAGPPALGFGRLFISPMGEPFRGPDGERRWFDGADANHDGVLTLDEFRADAMRVFKLLDRDGDGFIDGIENQAYETQVAPEIARVGFADEMPDGDRAMGREGGRGGLRRGGGGFGGFGGGPRGAGRLEGAARFSLLNIPQPVRGADLDLDWKVSAQEWAKAAAQRFALLDKAKAGKLAFDTLPPLPGHRAPKPARKSG